MKSLLSRRPIKGLPTMHMVDKVWLTLLVFAICFFAVYNSQLARHEFKRIYSKYHVREIAKPYHNDGYSFEHSFNGGGISVDNEYATDGIFMGHYETIECNMMDDNTLTCYNYSEETNTVILEWTR